MEEQALKDRRCIKLQRVNVMEEIILLHTHYRHMELRYLNFKK